MSEASQRRSELAVELIGLEKSFGAVAANRGISLQVPAGTIHAIVGENGAGKSTAMKMLYGVLRPDAGEIRIHGKTCSWSTPADAMGKGLGMVHQHFMLADPYPAYENLFLGSEESVAGGSFLPKAFRFFDRKRALARLEALSRESGLHVDWEKPVEELPVGVQQRIEILKLLDRNASILILDEPTAVLTPQETRELFVNLRKLVGAGGKTVLIITHKLKEVMSLADDVTVFRAGRVVGSRKVSGTTPEELASLMVGRKVNLAQEPPPAPRLGDAVLEVKGFTLNRLVRGRPELSGLEFEVRSGEIVGIAGVEGNGQSELLQALIRPASYAERSQGDIRCLGRPLLIAGNPRACPSTREIRSRVGLIPEDRHREGLLLGSSMEDNFLLGQQRRKGFHRHGMIDREGLRSRALRAIEEYDVRPRSLQAQMGGLSGGNQQKLIIAREFENSPRFLIAAQPTRGVDVGAIESIHRRMIQARSRGAGILLVSSELDEILALSDRILVFFEGRIAARFKRGEATERELGLHMGGQTHG